MQPQERRVPPAVARRENQFIRLLLEAKTPQERAVIYDWYRRPPAAVGRFYRAQLFLRRE